MKIYLTELTALCKNDGELKIYSGPNIYASTWKEAEEIAEKYYGSYLNVIRILTSYITPYGVEIPMNNLN